MTDSEAPIKEGIDTLTDAAKTATTGVDDASKITMDAEREPAADAGASVQEITKKLKRFGS